MCSPLTLGLGYRKLYCWCVASLLRYLLECCHAAWDFDSEEEKEEVVSEAVGGDNDQDLQTPRRLSPYRHNLDIVFLASRLQNGKNFITLDLPYPPWSKKQRVRLHILNDSKDLQVKANDLNPTCRTSTWKRTIHPLPPPLEMHDKLQEKYLTRLPRIKQRKLK